jgi:hypothetical protein
MRSKSQGLTMSFIGLHCGLQSSKTPVYAEKAARVLHNAPSVKKAVDERAFDCRGTVFSQLS